MTQSEIVSAGIGLAGAMVGGLGTMAGVWLTGRQAAKQAEIDRIASMRRDVYLTAAAELSALMNQFAQLPGPDGLTIDARGLSRALAQLNLIATPATVAAATEVSLRLTDLTAKLSLKALAVQLAEGNVESEPQHEPQNMIAMTQRAKAQLDYLRTWSTEMQRVSPAVAEAQIALRQELGIATDEEAVRRLYATSTARSLQLLDEYLDMLQSVIDTADKALSVVNPPPTG